MDKMTKEAIRYLGYGNKQVEPSTFQMIQECFAELDEIAQPKHLMEKMTLEWVKDGHIQINQIDIFSKDLCKNLKGCQEVVLFCATLGVQVDRQIQRYGVSDITRAVVLQACAAAYLESYCDQIQEQIEGLTRPRFSPGYGDLSLQHHDYILEWLHASKKIGLTRTEGYMLIPTKSITAFIGIQRSTT